MSTANYLTQKDFNLYVYEPDISDIYIRDFFENNNYLTNGTFDDLSDREKDNIIAEYINLEYEDELDNLRYLINEINQKLLFHRIRIVSGYFSGLQTYIELIIDPEELTNEECKYNYNLYKSQVIRKYQAEIKRINQKYLPYLHNNSGLKQIKCIGIFSNGEAIYEKVG